MKSNLSVEDFLSFVARIHVHNPSAVNVRQFAATLFDPPPYGSTQSIG